MGPLGIAFGFLAALSLWAAWRDADWRGIAGALVVSYVMSNLSCLYLDVQARPAVYTSTEIVIALMAFMAAHGRYYRAASVLLCLTFISVFCNLSLAFTYSIKWADVHAHEVRTNLIYVAENLITIWVGMRQRDHITGWFGGHSRNDSSDALAQEASEQ